MNDNKITYGELVDFILITVEECRMFNGKVDWDKVSYMAKQQFKDEDCNKERLRGIYRRNTEDGFKENAKKYSYATKDKKYGRDVLRKQLVSRLKKRSSLEYLLDTLTYPKDEILAEIMQMELDGFSINKWVENGVQFFQIEKRKYKTNREIDWNVDDEIKIGIFSDTHIGHKQSKITEMQKFIKTCYDSGVRKMLFAGDLVEGHYMSIRPTSIKELDAIGFDEQLALANKVLPHYDGLTYSAISANHDGSFDRNAFANPVKTLSLIRDDFEYLGHNFAKVKLTENVSITLVHPDDGIGDDYALKMRKHIDKAPKEKLSRFIIMGHYHKFAHLHYKGIDGWIFPSFVGLSNFMDNKNLASVVGGMILTIKFDKKGNVISFIPEYYFLD